MVAVGSAFYTPNHYLWECHNGFVDVGTVGAPAGVKDQCLRLEAGTTMHELGHNLDLRHGGDEDLNYKPNYISVMNYLYQNGAIEFAVAPGSTTFDHWELDYSDRVYPTLDEEHLDERFGLSGALDDRHIAKYTAPCQDPIFLCLFTAPAASGLVDWNDNGAIEADVAWDLRYGFEADYSLLPLHGFDDWAHVQQFLNTPAYKTGQMPLGRPQP